MMPKGFNTLRADQRPRLPILPQGAPEGHQGDVGPSSPPPSRAPSEAAVPELPSLFIRVFPMCKQIVTYKATGFTLIKPYESLDKM